MDKKNYRRGVGMIIMNHEGRFWLGQRIGTDTWQFPQGGIDTVSYTHLRAHET